MITELRIENFAIIPQLELRFKSGLIVFTGETGAGKSIILDAIEAVVGGKADANSIRAGSDRATVEATFRFPERNKLAIREVLAREELLDEEDFVTLTREIRREGRSTSRVNGHSASVNLMRELGAFLVDIHGQSEHLSLLNIKHHIDLLDRFANDEVERSTYQALYRTLQAVRKDLASLRQSEVDALRKTDLLTFQAGEIEAARLRVEEEEDLKQERSRLANAESLANLAQQAINLLDESSPEAPSASDQLGQVAQALTALSRIDESQQEISDQAQTLVEMVSDITRDLRSYLDKIEFNPKRLEQVEERLEVIHTLKRKYGGSIESVLAYAQDARHQLDLITHAGERLEELEKQEVDLLSEITLSASQLSIKRKQAAETLASSVERELAELNMSGARFSVQFTQQLDESGIPNENGEKVNADELGIDKVEFLIAPNPGEGLKPLVKIASGGETSRLMLALKNVLTQADNIHTLIFDEIDQGIGGRVGMTVGEKLWRLGRAHQVFVVTHLPQLAAFGDQHYRVRKQVYEGRTVTLVDPLSDEDRLEELAQMLGSLSEANRVAAQETLVLARQRASTLVTEAAS
jgi:DNA repair protein RecN (Recombination protein N)